MGVISRGIKNAFRNTVRTFSITLILGLSIAMSLIMLLALKTVQAKIVSVKSSIGNTITVSPAGVKGFEGGGELLTQVDADNISALAHVSKVTKVLNDRLTSEDSNLVAAIEAGSFGNRQRGRTGESTNSNTNRTNQAPANFKMPITVLATSDFDVISSLNVSQFDITSGAKFDVNSEENVALIGQELATKNNLTVGSIFKAYNTDAKVVGIFDTGNKFTNGSVVMPIKTLQKLSGQTDQINSMVVQTNSIDSVSTVQAAIKEKLGDKTDVVSSQDNSGNAVKPLENIKTITLYSLIGSLAAGAIIIFLTMIMIVRERRREIGVLKAIGSSNINIVAQFISEALSLTFLSSIVGILLGIAFSNPVLKVLVSNSESSSTQAPERITGGAGMMMQRIGGGIGNAKNVLSDIHAVIGWDIILYGLLAAVVIAILGSAIPAFFIAKVRPAEVMRQE